MTIEPASYTDEKFALYQSYQTNIHKETKERSSSGFKRFLVETPLQVRILGFSVIPIARLNDTPEDTDSI